MTVAIALDHSSDTVSSSLIDLCLSYKSKFNLGENRKLVGPTMQFPEKYRKKVKSSETPADNTKSKSNADKDKAKSKDAMAMVKQYYYYYYYY